VTDYPPSQLPRPSAGTVARAGSRFRGKWWLVLTFIPLGFTTWAAFLYIGIAARRPRWLGWAAVYAALFAGYAVLDTARYPSGAAETAAAVCAIAAWVGGAVHGIAIRDDVSRRILLRRDPAIRAARSRLAWRAEGRRLVTAEPALAREIGVGRPDIAGANDYGLVDINHAAAAAIGTLPGITDDVARQIVSQRADCGGFASAEDLGLVLNMPPGVVDQIRDTAVFIPD
jgi:Helix-hairpin-helix motif